MDKIVSENLFLLEFLVDKCMVLPTAISREIQQVAGETCVCFKFLDNGPLDVCEEDFTPKQNYTEEGNTRSGKSCLFALSATQAEDALKEFDVEVSVFKKLTNGMLPDKIQIGISVIPIVSLFNEVIQLLQASEQPETVSRTLKDVFNITNPNNEIIGNISVFIRMSCFGKVIVTQFQMNLEDKSVFFKDKEGKSLYKYRKASKCETGGEKPATPVGVGGGGGGGPGVGGGSASPCVPSTNPAYDPTEGHCQNCSPEMAGQYGDFNTAVQPYQPKPFQSQLSEKGNFQEIGAEMNGNAITIRVHKDKGTVKRIDNNENDTFISDQDNYGKNYQNDPPCICLGQQQPGPPQSNGCCCLKGQAAQTFRGAPCADKQYLSLKPGNDPANPFAFRVSGCPNAVPNNVTVVSPTSTRPDGMQVTEISDPSRDVFVLRIGKKSENCDKKANLELELVTPKGIERKPIPKKVTRETQYLASDAGPEPAAKGGKGGKGKGGKGKGGKKKK